MTHFIRLIPNIEGAAQWREFDNRQSQWFELMCSVPKADEARTQSRLPTVLSGLGLYAAADIAPVAYAGSVIDSAKVRADGRPISLHIDAIYGCAEVLVTELKSSLATPPDSDLLPREPRLLADLPACTERILSQALFRRRLREVAREDEFRACCEVRESEPSATNSPTATEWDMMTTRHRILAIRGSGPTPTSRRGQPTSRFARTRCGAS